MITPEQQNNIGKEAEREYPDVGCDGIHFPLRDGYIAAATLERERAKVLLEGLEKISRINAGKSADDIIRKMKSVAVATIDTYNKTINNEQQ